MKRLLLVLLLSIVPLSWAEEINIICKYVEGSKRTGGESGKTHTYSSADFSSDSIIIDIDTKKSSIYFNGKNDYLPFFAIQEGNEIQFNSKLAWNVVTGELDEFHEVFGFWEEGTINRETGELRVVNYSKQEGDRGFEFGYEKKYLCKKYEPKF